jgi:magnesium transporter
MNVTNELTLCQAFIDAHSSDAARSLERLPYEQSAALLEAIPPPVAARALAAMVPTVGADCFARLPPTTARAILGELHASYAAVLLRRLDHTRRSAILEQMPPGEAGILSTILDYPSDSAGALMETRVFTAGETLRVSEALAALRKQSRQVHDYVFVVDGEHRLVGIVGIRDLVSARRHQLLADVMNRAAKGLPATANRAAVLTHPGWKRFHTLPVVDDTGVLVGAIPHATVRAIFEVDALGGASRADAVTTVFALGELYWLGLSGVLDGITTAVQRAGRRNGDSREVSHGDQ